MYVIVNVKTGKFVCGTDFRKYPYRQFTSEDQMLTFPDIESADVEYCRRMCGKNYKIARLEKPKISYYVTRGCEHDNFN